MNSPPSPPSGRHLRGLDAIKARHAQARETRHTGHVRPPDGVSIAWAKIPAEFFDSSLNYVNAVTPCNQDGTVPDEDARINLYFAQPGQFTHRLIDLVHLKNLREGDQIAYMPCQGIEGTTLVSGIVVGLNQLPANPVGAGQVVVMLADGPAWDYVRLTEEI